MTDEPVRNVYEDEEPLQDGEEPEEELAPGEKSGLLDKVEAAFEIGKILRKYNLDIVAEGGDVKLVKLT